MKTIEQLELEIDAKRETMAPEQLVTHVITLYCAELEKANEALAQLRRHPSDARLVTELVTCLTKYQARYHNAPFAKALWTRADLALKAFGRTNRPEEEEAHRVKAEDTPA